jgi:hypothetical protein
MTRRRQPPSQGWKTFLRNHADGMAAAKLMTTPIRRIPFALLRPRRERPRGRAPPRSVTNSRRFEAVSDCTGGWPSPSRSVGTTVSVLLPKR